MYVIYPPETQWPQMVTLQSVEHHTGLAHHLWFLTFGQRASAQMSKIKDGGLVQYGAQRSDVYLGLRRLCNVTDRQYYCSWSAAVIVFSVALVRHCDSCWSSLLLWILVTCNVSFYISSSRFNPSKVRSLALKAESLTLRVQSLLTSQLSDRREVTIPGTEHHRPLAGIHFTVPQRVEGWVNLGDYLHTKIKCRLRDSNPDTVTHLRTNQTEQG